MQSGHAEDRSLHSGWGGARPGAGGKPAGYVKSEDLKDLDKQKARHEKAKADLAELAFRTKVGELVARAAVKQGAATAFATLAQGLRTIPDLLERRHAIDPEVAETVGREIDECLDALATALEMMTPAPLVVEDDDAA